MTLEQEKEIKKTIDKIEKYPKGFEFTINYTTIPTKAKENGLKYILNKAKEMGLIECIATGLSIEDIRGESGRTFNEETFRRL